MNFQNEQFLVQELLADSEAAYRYVVTNYHSHMLYVAQAIAGPSIAEEIVQEAWVSVIKNLAKFEGRSTLKTWIIRITSNCAKTRLRKESRSITVGNANDVESSAVVGTNTQDNTNRTGLPSQFTEASPDELLTGDELESVIFNAINKLPRIQKSIITLRDMSGLSMKEICKILDVSESNSRVLLHRARTSVLASINNYQGDHHAKL